MPLRRAALTGDMVPAPEGFAAAVAALASADAQTRRHAAGALGHHEPEDGADEATLAALVARLGRETDGFVQEAIFAALGNIGGAAAAAMLAPLVRLDDAALRNGALEALKRLQGAAEAAVDALLADGDADVRLLSVEVMRGWAPAAAQTRLLALLAQEAHVNVVGAALDVAAAVGDAALLPVLGNCQARFAGDGFIAFAIAEAMRAISARAAAPGPPSRRKTAARKPRKAGP